MAIYYTIGTDMGSPVDGARRWKQMPPLEEAKEAAEALRSVAFIASYNTLHVVKVTGRVQGNSLG